MSRFKPKEIFKTEIAGFEIKLELTRPETVRSFPLFRLTYGLQVKENLQRGDAAHELGASIMHALVCEGKLDE